MPIWERRRRANDAVAPPDAPMPHPVERAMRAYNVGAETIVARHEAQTIDTVDALRRKYETPAFGDVRVWELVEMLARCIDPSDGRLFCASQQVHVLQMLDAMERDGVDDPDLLLATLIHDCGKVLLLTDEDPANIVGMNTPIGSYEPGVGLDNVTFQWSHDEFGYSRFVEHVPDHLAWLVRYHSIELYTCEHLMDERDRDYYERFLKRFFHYDHETKTPFVLPQWPIESFRDVVEDAFPKPIRF